MVNLLKNILVTENNTSYIFMNVVPEYSVLVFHNIDPTGILCKGMASHCITVVLSQFTYIVVSTSQYNNITCVFVG